MIKAPNEQNEGATPADNMGFQRDDQEDSAHDSPEIAFGERTNDAFAENRLLKLLSAFSDRIESLSTRMADLEKALSAVRSGTGEQLLIQLLATSRETLIKVSASNKNGTELIEPLLRDVVGLVFNIDKLLQAQDNPALQVFRDAVVDIAERYGIQFYSPLVGDEFVPSQANAVRTEHVARKELGGKVTAVLRVGCRLNEKPLFYPQVSVSRFSPESVPVS